jgi:hypothetical protein
MNEMARTSCAFVLLCIVIPLAIPPGLHAQESRFIAMVPPFHDRLYVEGPEGSLQLEHQRFVIFVYRNAVAVYSSARFVNTGKDTLTRELALPSTGHDENGSAPGGRISTGILSVQLWVENNRVEPVTIHDGDEDWYTLSLCFAPGEHRVVKALFWAQTSLTDVDSLPGMDSIPIEIGGRGFLVDLSHAAAWYDVIESVSVEAVLKGGISFEKDAFSAEPTTYDKLDSTLTWSLVHVEPSLDDNVIILYTPSSGWGSAPNTMERLSTFIVRKVYDQLLGYARSTEGD